MQQKSSHSRRTRPIASLRFAAPVLGEKAVREQTFETNFDDFGLAGPGAVRKSRRDGSRFEFRPGLLRRERQVVSLLLSKLKMEPT